jgi:hypothetical protein
MSANAVEEQEAETELAEVDADEVWWIGAIEKVYIEDEEGYIQVGKIGGFCTKNKSNEEWPTLKSTKNKSNEEWPTIKKAKLAKQTATKSNDQRPTIKHKAWQGEDQESEKEEEVLIMPVDIEFGMERLTRESAMKFNEADVRRPLASAVSVARAGNRIVMEEHGGYIESKATGERMKMRVEKNTFVYDVQLEDGAMVAVTLDSGAGCNVWPHGLKAGKSKLMPKKLGIKMLAANGTEIENYGQRVVKFRGIEQDQKGDTIFHGHM